MSSLNAVSFLIPLVNDERGSISWFIGTDVRSFQLRLLISVLKEDIGLSVNSTTQQIY